MKTENDEQENQPMRTELPSVQPQQIKDDSSAPLEQEEVEELHWQACRVDESVEDEEHEFADTYER